MMYIWKSCLCFACKVNVDFTIHAGHQGIGYVLMEDQNMSHVGGVTRDFLMENPIHLRQKRIYLYTNVKNTRYSNRVTMYRRIKSLQQKLELEPLTYSSTRTSGPPTLTLAQVGVFNPGSGLSPGATNFLAHIRITYYCRLYDRVNLDA